MKNSPLSVLVGVTASVSFTVGGALPARAFLFNYDALTNITARPLSSNNILNFFGDPNLGQGYTAFFNLDPNAPDQGHREISLNSPGNIAPYYTVGRHASIEDGGNSFSRSATLQDGLSVGFSNFFNFLNDQGISLDSIGFSYGQKPGKDFKSTWNFGEDILGQDWFASPTSPIEERIYQANPEDVEIFLSYGTTKIINLDYTPFYSLFDYGATTGTEDDVEAVLTETVGATPIPGLSDPIAIGLAEAFLQDVELAGGGLQILYEDGEVEDVGFTTGAGGTYGVLRLPFPVSLRAGRATTIPESSPVVGLLGFGLLISLCHWTWDKARR